MHSIFNFFKLIITVTKILKSTQFKLPEGDNLSKFFYELPPNLKDTCPVIYALEIIGQKWKIPILWHLATEGALHYGELKRNVFGITNIMLTKSLRELEKDGLINREVIEKNPPRVKYSLTADGKSLVPILKAVEAWGKSQMTSKLI